MDWKSIEAAPMDGTSIIGIWDDGCHWQYRIVYYNDRVTEYVWSSVDNQLNMYPLDLFEYWMPLPLPPISNGA